MAKQNVKRATEYTLAELLELSREEAFAACDAEEAPLIEELAALDEQPLTVAERQARKAAIRDARLQVHHVRKVWRRLHGRSGGKQRITAAGLKP